MANFISKVVYYLKMYPVLVNIGNFQVSSFGFLLTIGIILGSFAVWRLARGYEIDSEKILDFIFLTVGAGFITSRIVYVLTNLNVFDSPAKIFFLNSYPGLSFFGGLFGSLLTMVWLTKKNEKVSSLASKLSLLQAGDFGIVGFLLAAFFAEIGCLLGGCAVGIETNLFMAVSQIGVIGKRFPIQFLEGLIFLISFLTFWKAAIKFHIQGSLFSKGLILVGAVKLISLLLKSESAQLKILELSLNLDFLLSVVVLSIGLRLYYKVYRKTPARDLKKLWKFFSDKKTQSQALANISKGWYNHWVNLGIMFGRGRKKLFKFLHIKPNPDNF